MTTAAEGTLAVLDMEQGLARLMGNSRIYFNALRRFGTHVAAAQGVAAQLAAGDQAGAHRTVHTLKGAAGLLGADEVQALAAEVEVAMARGQPVAPLLERLAAALQRVQQRIDAVMSEQADAPEARLPGMPETSVLFERLARMFEEGNGAAIELLERWETVLAGELEADAWQAVASAAHDYDFERAGAALRQARRLNAPEN